MRKTGIGIAVAVIVIIGAAALALPYYIGKRVEGGMPQVYEEYFKQPGLAVTGEQFESGWFDSKAVSRVSFGDEMSIVLHHDIRHGLTLVRPWRFQVVTVPELPDELAREFEPYLKGRPLVTLTSTVALDGSQRHDISSPEMRGIKGDVRFDWQGLEGEFRFVDSEGEPDVFMKDLQQAVGSAFQPLGYEVVGEMHAGSLQVESGETLFNMTGMKLEYDYDQWVGGSIMSIKTIDAGFPVAGQPAPMNLRIENASVEQYSTDLREIVNYTLSYGIESISLGEKQLTNLIAEMQFSNLSKQAFVNYMKVIKAAQERIAGQAQDAESGQMFDEEFIKRLQTEVLTPLFDAGPVFSINKIGADTPEGKVMGNMMLRASGDADLEEFDPMQDLEGRAELSMGCAMLEQIMVLGNEEQIREALKQQNQNMPDAEIKRLSQDGARQAIAQFTDLGVIERQGSECRTSAILRKGALSVNGIPLQKLMQAQ